MQVSFVNRHYPTFQKYGKSRIQKLKPATVAGYVLSVIMFRLQFVPNDFFFIPLPTSLEKIKTYIIIIYSRTIHLKGYKMEKPSYQNDIEQEKLEFSMENEVKFWEEKQRELISSTVDYNLGSIRDLNVDLSPHYQRRNRWDIERQSTLIESFLMNVPVPPVFLNEDEYGKYSVIDGKQRITTIKEFLDNKLILKGLTVFAELNGKSFKKLPITLQNVITTRPNLRAVIILRQSDKDIKHEVFQRLNTGGMILNPQEIRNNAFPGTLNDLIIKLSNLKEFHDLLGIKNKEKSRIYKEMRDVEFVLKFIALKENLKEYNGNMKLFLDDFMDSNRNPSKKKVAEYEKSFIETIAKVKATFGTYAFRRWLPNSNIWRQQVLASLFDAEMFAVNDFDIEKLSRNRISILESFKDLFTEGSQFRYAIDSATNNLGPLTERIKLLKSLIEKNVK